MFQVAVARQVRDRTVGRTRFEFAQRDVDGIPTAGHPTRSGTARVSTPAATALDVAADTARSGGADNAATVILELAELDTFDIAEVAGLTPLFPAAAGRRIGWILERFAGRNDLEPLQAVAHGKAGSPSRLDPAGSASGEVDPRWRLYLNRDLEPDA